MDKRKGSEILCIKETVKSKKLDFSSFYTKNRHDYLNYCYFCQVNTLQKSLAYTRYLRKARTKYYIHSPFVYQLCENVIFDKRHYYAFDEIEMRRAVLLNSKQIIEITDFGAGSTIFKDNKRKIGDLARYTASSAKKGRLLFRLVNYFQPKNILELGTSLGISTMYMAKAKKMANVHTIEGCKQTAAYAKQSFEVMQLPNITLHTARFEEILPQLLPKINNLDVVFFDGNHRSEATRQYFKQCLPYFHNDTVLVLDDIHWSADMEQFWQEIQQDEKVQISIDLFHIGLLFFRKEQAKEHFTLFF